jgi:RHS repeat-associated protein
MFEAVFDYGEGHYQEQQPNAEGRIFARANVATPQDSHWPIRRDAFSNYRAGFEVRTYRLCRRVLMFHHFPSELGTPDYLVRSTEFHYSENPIASFITEVTQSGYVRWDDGAYLKKSLPPLAFTYSQADIQDVVRVVAPENLENLPWGVDGSNYQWVDLDGEGISSILTEQADGWFYKRNLSPIKRVMEHGVERIEPTFGPSEVVDRKPNATLSSTSAQFLDLAGDGQLDLVALVDPVPGFYERNHEEGWEAFRAFVDFPNLPWEDPNLKFVDLTGDGHADILISEDEVLTWYPSLAESGFGWGERVRQALDEEKGPRIVFADGTQSIYLADLSGDGLTDLVRIRNGDVCYWPNLGYGRFGAKVTMDNAPWFDTPDRFDQRRIRLADIDGTGTTDILYLGCGQVAVYRNECGNGWSAAEYLANFPLVDNLSSVMAVDLFGNGTACLVWSSPLPHDGQQPMHYVDLMGGQKPHLLTQVVNNLGAETHIHYAASPRFYLEDKLAGKPWVTRIPFPVHVVEMVETYDRISRNRFVTRYAYHHGYFDGEEREFRGFGMVEQWDTEEIGTVGAQDSGDAAINWDAASFVPPVKTKTWFHTGAFFEGGRISRQFEQEYYREGDPSLGEGQLTDEQLETMLLEDTVLPDDLSAEEIREACRSLKGGILRQEVYALERRPDGTLSEAADRPYTVSERNYTIKRLQPRDSNQHAVFFSHARETIDFQYERRLYDIEGEMRADPRVTHAVTLAVDDFGNVLQSVAIGYGRRFDDPDPLLTDADRAKQSQTLLTLTENGYTNPVAENDAYRTPLPSESRSYELIKLHPDAAMQGITNLFRFDELRLKIQAAGHHDISYQDYAHAEAVDNHPYRRLIEQVRGFYRPDDLGESNHNDPDTLLPFGRLQSLALPGESYKLALTQELVTQIYRRGEDDLLPDAAAILTSREGDGGGYVDLDGDGRWWIPSGRIYFSPNTADNAFDELAFAREHFFLPHRYSDPFHQETTVAYDSNTNDAAINHNLLVVRTTDAVGNVVTVETQDDQGQADIRINYRVLQPFWMTDPNGNRSRVCFDALGLVVAAAVIGKPGQRLGDSLDHFTEEDTNPSLVDLQPFVDDDPSGQAGDLLENASTRILYDIDRYQRCGQPPFAAVMARETHVSDLDLQEDEHSRIQISFVYSDGFGREVQTKIQAEPGDAPQREENIALDTGDIEPGTLVYDENGKPQQRRTDRRWVGTGRTVYNNKGKPVKKYEPFFSSSHLYEPESEMTDTGMTPVLFYDPVGRVIATLHPNDTYEKVVFDPWRQMSYDVNDTVTSDPRADEDIQGYVAPYFSAQPDNWQTWHGQRIGGQQGTEEREAANKAARHAGTPTVAFFDTLGRPFLTIAHNRRPLPQGEGGGEGMDQFYATRVILDIEGNPREVIDAMNRIVMRYDYDLLGNRIHQISMEAGERWLLNDVAGKPIQAWNSRRYVFRMEYDPLRRPLNSFVQGGDSAEPNGTVFDEEILYARTIYGDSLDVTGLTVEQQQQINLRGKVYQIFDGAGVVTNFGINPETNQPEAYDFKGNLLRSRRQLAADYKNAPDWSQDPALEQEIFSSSTRYDALNRPLAVTAPDNSVYRPTYNEANLLERVDVNLQGRRQQDGQPIWESFVVNIDYNAKGQRTAIQYQNDAETRYDYDEQTFRLINLRTTRPANANGLASSIFRVSGIVQDLYYTYDPVGNITRIADASLASVFHDGQEVTTACEYTYDAVYRLIQATGREHIGQSALQFAPPNCNYRDHPFVGAALLNDLQALRNYTELYEYDAVGNFERMRHQAGVNGWTRGYDYGEPSLIEPAQMSNRLSRTTIAGVVENYTYDAHGNMTTMPHLPVMAWDFHDQLCVSQQQVTQHCTGERTYYVYDASGQRVRKVTKLAAQAGETPCKKNERMYLGGFEIYREYSGATSGSEQTVRLERQTLHVMDDKQRIALVETRTLGDDGSPEQTVCYQFGNHLGSVSLELDRQAELICYEEYTPYGSPAYQAGRSGAEVSRKRYRYTGMERDEENGLNYHGARYYAVWLGIWTRPDPFSIGPMTDEGPTVNLLELSQILKKTLSVYSYTGAKPMVYVDQSGRDWQPVGRIYVARGLHPTTGEPSIYVGQTQQEIRARFSRHRWRGFLRASTTTVTEYRISADLPSGLSAEALRRARGNALGAAELELLTRHGVEEGRRILNAVSPRTPANAAEYRRQYPYRADNPRDVPRSEILRTSVEQDPRWSTRVTPVREPDPREGMSVTPVREPDPREGMSVTPAREPDPREGMSVTPAREPDPREGMHVTTPLDEASRLRFIRRVRIRLMFTYIWYALFHEFPEPRHGSPDEDAGEYQESRPEIMFLLQPGIGGIQVPMPVSPGITFEPGFVF